MLYQSRAFRIEIEDGVLTLWLDFRGRPNHRLTLATLNELSLVLDRVASVPSPAAMLLRSSHPEAFLEEFDTAELTRFGTPLEFAALARRGQDVTRKLAILPVPTVAVIAGRCQGAGLELALACNHRFGVDTPHTRFESGEVRRGLVPTWGGTHRLPRLIGVQPALRLLMADNAMGPEAARTAGLLDALVPEAQSGIELQAFLDRLRSASLRSRRGKLRRVWYAASSAILGPNSLSRPGRLAPAQAGSAAAEVTRCVAAGLRSEGEGLAAERTAIGRLALSAETGERLALAQRAAAPPRVYPETIAPVPPVPQRVGVVGESETAIFLACRLAHFGHEVFLHGPEASEAAELTRRVALRTADLVRLGRLTPQAGARINRQVQVTASWVGFENVDLVLEAGGEDAGEKRNLFHELERRVRPRVILATAGTAIPVDLIQAEMDRPGRIAGLHFPNLDDQPTIAEIVGSEATNPATIATLDQWSRVWGFLPICVADRPGRLVDLVRLAYLSEGVALVSEGFPIDQVDRAARRFGMTRGPLEWCDEIGLDRLAERIAHLRVVRGDSFARNLLFQRLIPYGAIGKSVGEGFYRYGRHPRPNPIVRMVLWQDLDADAVAPYVFDPDEAIREGLERLVLRTVNEAAAALVDEPDADPATVDLALAYGMGWAPGRGGPLRHADSLGLAAVVDRLAYFAERYGARFTPCDELVRRAEAGESFYTAAMATPRLPRPRQPQTQARPSL